MAIIPASSDTTTTTTTTTPAEQRATCLPLFCPKCRCETQHELIGTVTTAGGGETERYRCTRCRKHVHWYAVR